MNIAIVSKNKDKFSETFIHNQVKHLPFTSHFLYGDYLPTHYGKDQIFLKNKGVSSAIRIIREKIFATSETDFLKEEIAKFLIQENIQVVLANYALSAIPFLDICQQTNIPLVVHFHGYTAYRNDIYENNIAGYQRLFKESAAIVSVSEHMTKRLISIGAPTEKITKIVYGIDGKLFFPPSATHTKKTILYNGRFCDTKNPHLVIEAFAELLKQIPEAELIMAGDGELMENSVALAESLGVKNKINFRGMLPHKDVAEQMRNAAVLVQFSATTASNDTEGTPLAVLEAGLCGLPVIASRSGGLPEIIFDNENGYLVNELDVSALTSKMYEALTSRDKSLQMAVRLRENVLANYTIEKYTNALASLLKTVATSKV